MKTKEATAVAEQSADYKNMVDLLAVCSEATNRLTVMQAELNEEMLDAIDPRRDDYAKLQKSLTESEASLELIALRNPGWFVKKKSITTPYGTLSTKTSTKLEIPNEEATIILIENHDKDTEDFDKNLYVKTAKVLDREALEKLEDVGLAKFRIKRVKKINVNIEPANIDMGKAVKEEAKAK